MENDQEQLGKRGGGNETSSDLDVHLQCFVAVTEALVKRKTGHAGDVKLDGIDDVAHEIKDLCFGEMVNGQDIHDVFHVASRAQMQEHYRQNHEDDVQQLMSKSEPNDRPRPPSTEVTYHS